MSLGEDEDVRAKVGASSMRRFFALCVLYVLAALLLYTAVVASTVVLHQILLSGAVIGVFFLAEKMRSATQFQIHLTETCLRRDDGALLVSLEQITNVDRGALAFKPSNGFTLSLKRPVAFAWYPGLYWQIGRKLAVGGVCAVGETKFMAEQIGLKIAQRHES